MCVKENDFTLNFNSTCTLTVKTYKPVSVSIQYCYLKLVLPIIRINPKIPDEEEHW